MDGLSANSSINVTGIPIAGSGQPAETEVEVCSATYRWRNMLIGLTGVVLKVLTLLAVMKHKDLTRFLRCALASLVSTDLGLLATIFVASLLYLPPDYLTLGIAKMVYVFCDCTALTLLVIAVDRACALHFPVWYKSITEHHMKIKVPLVVLLPWILAVFFSMFSFKDDIQGLPRYPVVLLKDHGVLLQAVVLCTCTAGVFLASVAIVLKLRLRARRLMVHPDFLNNSVTGLPTPSEYQRCRRLTVRTIFLAVLFCIVYFRLSSYLLFLYMSQIDTKAELNSPCNIGLSSLILLFLYMSQIDTKAELNSPRNIGLSSLIMVNSIVNPFLFFWRLVNIREAVSCICRLFQIGRLSSPQVHGA